MSMGKKKLKEICKWDKGSYEQSLPQLLEVVQEPRFACKTCGRVSRYKKYLCKPVKFPDADTK